ncbi:uncharacterized protein LOC128997640 [Macrosteles quadrilineatus]|uniref:uncharacterized protein LOC128997640 n=1 Tax=Macrosteles quadrilineatus TaxID=74068 RepID=UPI0023E0B3E8|nr:uncharacterized protein LOC128997640 [Macrosteles quadrilineatus]
MSVEFGFVKSNRGVACLVVGSYRFVKQAECKFGRTKWFCERRRRGRCQAKVFTDGGTIEIATSDFTHNHEADEDKYIRQAVSNSCKRKALDDMHCKPEKILKSEVENPKEALSEKAFRCVRRNLYNARRWSRYMEDAESQSMSNNSSDGELSLPYLNPTNLTEHSHPPNKVAKEVAKMRLQLREVSMSSSDGPLLVLASTLHGTPDEVKGQLGSVDTIKRDLRIHRQRANSRQPVSRSYRVVERKNIITRVYTVDNGDTLSREAGAHQHEPVDKSVLMRDKIRNIVKRKALENLEERPGQLINKEIKSNEEALNTLTKTDISYIKNSMRKARCKSRLMGAVVYSKVVTAPKSDKIVHMKFLVIVFARKRYKMSAKRKRVVVTVQHKLEALERLAKGESARKVSEELGVGLSTVKDWKRNKQSIVDFYNQVTSRRVLSTIRYTCRKPTHELVDEALWQWFVKEGRRGTPINGPMLKEKASELHLELEGGKFVASDGWLARWKKRHGVNHEIMSGKKLSADLEENVNNESEVQSADLDENVNNESGVQSADLVENVNNESGVQSADKDEPSVKIECGELESDEDEDGVENYSVDEIQSPEWGVPKIVKLHPEHNHPPNAVEREATLLRCQMRDECLKEPTKRPVDILKETIASSTGEVREYLEKNQESIRRDMRRVRTTQMREDQGELPAPKRQKPKGRPKKTTTSTVDDDLHSANPNSEPSSSIEGTSHHSVTEIKDELIIEDVETSEDTYYESEDAESAAEEKYDATNATADTSDKALPSASTDFSSPFETIICEQQVKQELMEDETDGLATLEDFTPESTESCASVPNIPQHPQSEYSQSTMKSLNALTRLTNTFGPPANPHPANEDINAMKYPLQPLNYFGPNMAHGYPTNNYNAFPPPFSDRSVHVNNAPNLPYVRAANQPSVSATNLPYVRAANHPPVSATNLPYVRATNQPPVSATNLPYVRATNQPSVSAINLPYVMATNQPSVSATNLPYVRGANQSSVSATNLPFNNTNQPSASPINIPVFNARQNYSSEQRSSTVPAPLPPMLNSTNTSVDIAANLPITSATNIPFVSAAHQSSVSAINSSINSIIDSAANPPVTNHSATNLPDSVTNLTSVSNSSASINSGANLSIVSVTSISEEPKSQSTSTVASGTNPPSDPPEDGSSTSCPSDFEHLEGIFISLKTIPKERRKKTKDKLLRLVKLITDLNLDPDDVSFALTTK